MTLNHTIFFTLNDLVGKYIWFDRLVFFVAERLDWIIIGLAVVFLLLHMRKKGGVHTFFKDFRAQITEIFLITLSVGVAWICTRILKIFFATPRPEFLFDNVHVLFSTGGFDSFPSGHATFSAALATMLYFEHKGVGIVFGIFALLIGVSRIIAGVHFPVDILGGYFIGIAIASAIYMLFLRKVFYNKA